MKKIIINTKNAPAAIGPYSQAVLVDKTLYCSGQIAINPKKNLIISSSIKEETEMIMKNIFEILSSAQMNFDNIVKCTIFLKNMDDYNEVNKVYSKYFKRRQRNIWFICCLLLKYFGACKNLKRTCKI